MSALGATLDLAGLPLPTVDRRDALAAQLRAWRGCGERIALVPTMGNLHAGHLALVECARQHAARVVVSIFVNPTQFGPDEDYARYPRTLAADVAALTGVGADLVFAPSAAQMYPHGLPASVALRFPHLDDILCGALRPGHFGGVGLVVAKLLNLIAPDVAIFGAKDYQQVLVVRALAEGLDLPVEIIVAPTVREADGLALSSRNQYLSPAERAKAPAIYAELRAMAQGVGAGAPLAGLEAAALAALTAQGFAPDYAVVRAADTLGAPAPGARQHLVALIAARLGTTRLIDNLLIDRENDQ